MALPNEDRLYTPEEYLELERKAEYKSEYIDGRIYPMIGSIPTRNALGEVYFMPGASEKHILITANMVGLLWTQFRTRPCKVYSNDMKVKVSSANTYTYPDIVAVCGKSELDDTRLDTLLNPTVIIEVLSPSTEAYDRGDKFAQYRKIATLAEYVLISQNKARVEYYVRQSEGAGQWVLSEISGLDGILPLTSVGCEVSLRDIYDKVEFSEEIRLVAEPLE